MTGAAADVSPQQRAERADGLVADPRRLAAVRETQLLDSPPEESFDALTRLATELLGTPASFFSVVDDGRDFYKSQAGMQEPFATEREMCGRTFCHFTLACPVPLVINDTYSDPVWRTVPTVSSVGVRAYLGVPMFLNDQPIGSLCAIDVKPRVWSQLDVNVLTQFAHSAMREVQLRSALRSVNARADRANALARANEELLAVVAHDLRTPLQVVSLTATLLAKNNDASLTHHLARLNRAAKAMGALVNNLLATHAIGSNSASVQTDISAHALLNDARSTMDLVADAAGITVTLGKTTDDPVRVDYAQLLRVLCNLLSNCVKYCPRGSAVVLAATVGEEVTLTVSDNGPGMTAAQIDQAFDRGWKAIPDLSQRAGAGLGLGIVKSLVEDNRGQISLSSTLGQGTVVTIQLPRATT